MPIQHAAATAGIVGTVATAAAHAPWWFAGMVGVAVALVSVLAVVATEWARAKWGGRDRLALARETAVRQGQDADRDDTRELLKILGEQYTAMLTSNREIVVQNAELGATVKLQAAQIDRLTSDVKTLQEENAVLMARLERMTALDAEVATLKARIADLLQQNRDKDTEIMRLQIALQAAQGVPRP